MKIINATLPGELGTWIIEIEGQKIKAVEPLGEVPGAQNSNEEVYDAKGRLVVPQFVEAHIHLDYANTSGVPRDNESGTLFEAITIWAERKERGFHQKEDIKTKAREAVRSAVSHGVGFIRSHVDVTDESFAGFEAIAELREELSELVDIQIVAFPQNGVYAYHGGLELVERALKEGADVVGGIPHLEPTRDAGVQSLQVLFDLAEKYQLPIDVHTDEIDDPASRFVDTMAAEATKRSMGPQTVVSHSVAMGYYPPGYMARLMPKIAASEIRFAVCPNENLHLQGLGFHHPVPRGMAPIKALTEAGVAVSLCQDSINDPFYPLGDANPLRILDSGFHVGHMLTPSLMDRSLDFITHNPAGNLGLEGYGIASGQRADLLVLDASSQREALQRGSEVLLSVHKGREVFRRQADPREWKVNL